MSDMNDNSWTLAFVCVGVLLLYSLSRIIALHRRLRDVEARPPVDDIVMRGMIRQQVSELLTQLEKKTKLETKVEVEKKVQSVQPVQPDALPSTKLQAEVPVPEVQKELEKVEIEPKKVSKKKKKAV